MMDKLDMFKFEAMAIFNQAKCFSTAKDTKC